eukprot:8495569-Ditylum_brightwellii.AAC.1
MLGMEVNILMLCPPHPVNKKINAEARAKGMEINLETMMGQHGAKRLRMTAKVDINGAQTTNTHVLSMAANWIALFEHNWMMPKNQDEQPFLVYDFY